MATRETQTITKDDVGDLSEVLGSGLEHLDDVHADVTNAKTIEDGFAAFVRGFVTKIRPALGDAYTGEAQAIMDEAGNNADKFGAAIKAGTDIL
jgi:hypothetical protein